MSATIEERLARYTAQLDEAANRYAQQATRAVDSEAEVLPAPPDRRRRYGRRTRVAALGAAVCVAAALAATISIVRSDRNVNVSTITSVPTLGRVTTSPTSTAPATTAPTTTTGIKPTPPGTQQITYQPFSGNAIDPSLHVTQRLTGTCVSPGSGLRNGYRCFADGGAIYDPCFAGPNGTADPLVCPNDPIGRDVVELTARSVTSDPPPAVTNPWEIELSSGQLCRLVAAAWGTGGPYSCDKTGVAQPVADCHVPVPAQPWWTAECQEQLTDTSPFAASTVVKVWY
jgi:hypothetical protein